MVRNIPLFKLGMCQAFGPIDALITQAMGLALKGAVHGALHISFYSHSDKTSDSNWGWSSWSTHTGSATIDRKSPWSSFCEQLSVYVLWNTALPFYGIHMWVFPPPEIKASLLLTPRSGVRLWALHGLRPTTLLLHLVCTSQPATACEPDWVLDPQIIHRGWLVCVFTVMKY